MNKANANFQLLFVFLCMRHSIESNIRRHAVIIYLLVTLLCCGIIAYVFTLRNNIISQKSGIEYYYNIFTLTNDFIYAVNEAQSEANLYVLSKNQGNLWKFRTKRNEISTMIDSLAVISNDSSQIELWKEIGGLLRIKDRTIQQLNQEFENYDDPLTTITETISTYEIPVVPDSIVVSTVVSDTTYTVTEKKNFWKRLSSAFSSSKGADTIMTITALQKDTIRVVLPDTSSVWMEVTNVAEEASIQYSRQLHVINRQINKLLTTDQSISQQLSELTNQLYRETLRSITAEIEASEQLIRKNHTISIIGCVVALILILIFFLLIINDVNKGHSARLSLEKANERIRQIMESRHKLLLSVSHDIKTPLNAILGYIELWRKEKLIPEKEITSIQNPGRHIQSLLSNLLDFSSLEQGSLTLSPVDFRPEELCREVTEMFMPLLKQKNLMLVKDIELAPELTLHADALKIKQVIINIFSNAVKYTEEGKIHFRVRYRDGKIIITIRDTGVGIPADKIGALFEPFTRVESTNQMAEGSGYGMYVVKGLADLMRGSVAIQSQPGDGTTVLLNIPAEKVRSGDVSHPLRVIIIDDDETLLRLLEKMLTKMGHIPVPYLVKDEIPSIDLQQADRILTDLEMGRIYGADILNKMRKHDGKPPVIVMTGRSEFSKEHALQMGFDDYLAKPFTFETLHSLLTPSEKAYDLEALEAFYTEDEASMRELLLLFMKSTRERITTLNECINTGDLAKAQAICHKMLPMFMQLDAREAVTLLKKMDANRNGDTTQYPDWKEDIQQLITITRDLLSRLYVDKIA